jgi:hypothetical protein
LPAPTPTPSYKSYSNYVTPTPTPQTKTIKVCITSSGLKESCKSYPNFYIEFCSAVATGNLEYKSGTKWLNLWKVSGIKNNRCNSTSTPYYTEVKGDLTSKTGIDLRLVYNADNGVTPPMDTFKVTVK